MMTNEKLRPYIFGFLAFCVLSSKHIIIYNEEILVALTFFAFVYFVYRYFGQTIQESLDERSQGIQQELESFSVLKKTALEELLQEHKKVGSLSGALQSLAAFTASQVQNACVTGNKTLQSVIAQDMSKKIVNTSSSFGAITNGMAITNGTIASSSCSFETSKIETRFILESCTSSSSFNTSSEFLII